MTGLHLSISEALVVTVTSGNKTLMYYSFSRTVWIGSNDVAWPVTSISSVAHLLFHGTDAKIAETAGDLC